MRTYTRTQTHTHAHNHTYIHTYIKPLDTSTYIHTHMHAYIHTNATHYLQHRLFTHSLPSSLVLYQFFPLFKKTGGECHARLTSYYSAYRTYKQCMSMSACMYVRMQNVCMSNYCSYVCLACTRTKSQTACTCVFICTTNKTNAHMYLYVQGIRVLTCVKLTRTHLYHGNVRQRGTRACFCMHKNSPADMACIIISTAIKQRVERDGIFSS